MLNSRREWTTRALGAVAIVGALITTSASGLAVALRPRGGDVAVVFPPWTDTQARVESVWRAGGSVIAVGDYGVIARGDDPEFLDRLAENGAWMILDGERGATLCGSTPWPA